MPERKKIGSGKAEKSDRRLKLSVEAIKKFKDRISKIGRRNSSKSASTVGAVNRTAKSIPKFRHAPMRNIDKSQYASHHVVPSRNVPGTFCEMTNSCSAEPNQHLMKSSHVTETSHNTESYKTAVMDASKKMEFNRSKNHRPESEQALSRSKDEFRIAVASRSTSGNVSRDRDVSNIPNGGGSKKINFSRKLAMLQNVEMLQNTNFAYNMTTNSKSHEALGGNMNGTHSRSMVKDMKSPPEKIPRSPPHPLSRTESMMLSGAVSVPEIQPRSSSPEEIKAVESLEKIEAEKLEDMVIEQQLASLNRRLKILTEENEKANKREEELFATKNQIFAKIELLKKQIEEAMNEYRGDAQSCREKIEKEEIFQNQMIMDLKESLEKLSDICLDINNQVDDMVITLNTYSVSENGVFYMIAASSVDIVARFFRLIIDSVSSFFEGMLISN